MCSGVKALASSLCLKEGDFMAMMTVYLGEAGADGQSDTAVASCLVSDVMRWEEVEPAWKSVLEEFGIIDCGFYMTDFSAGNQPYGEWSKEKRDRLIPALMNTMRKDRVFSGIAVAIVKEDYDRQVTGKLREKLGQYHYTFAVQTCLRFIEEWRNRSTVRQPMHYVFDDQGIANREIFGLFDDIAKRRTAVSFGIGSKGWSFVDRRAVVQLQPARMLAGEFFEYALGNSSTGVPDEGKPFASLLPISDITTLIWEPFALQEAVKDATAHFDAHGWDSPLLGW